MGVVGRDKELNTLHLHPTSLYHLQHSWDSISPGRWIDGRVRDEEEGGWLIPP